MTVGVNISPGWGDTVDGRDMAAMARVIGEFAPDALRMPWVDGASDDGRTQAALMLAASSGIDTVVIDNPTWSVERVVAGIATVEADGGRVTAVEGVNEPDLPPGGYSSSPVPIADGQLALVAERQRALYEAVAGRWPVLAPAAVYELNEPALCALPSDIINVHRYDQTQPFPSVPMDGRRPVWVTETGVASYRRGFLCRFGFGSWAVTPEQQRDRLVDYVEGLRAAGAERVIVYSLQDTGRNTCNPSHGYGLYTWQHVAKPAAEALRGS